MNTPIIYLAAISGDLPSSCSESAFPLEGEGSLPRAFKTSGNGLLDLRVFSTYLQIWLKTSSRLTLLSPWLAYKLCMSY